MPRFDAAVVGAGLAGMTAAIGLADAGARVIVVATGHAAGHWMPGGIDVGISNGAVTPRVALDSLAGVPGHPYGFLAPHLPEALAWLRAILAAEGLEYVGELDDPIQPIPTSIGALRAAAILPAAAAGALPEWQPGERLVVCGPAGFRDFWPEAIAASLRHGAAWAAGGGPDRIDALTVELPGLAGRRNMSGLDVARAFDDPEWRDRALDAVAGALDRAGGAGGGHTPGRVALPAILGLDDHIAALDAARERLPLVPFEVALAPPSVPGIRLHRAMRSALRKRGGRLQVGEAARGTVGSGVVSGLTLPAAARELHISAGLVVLATGGIAGGGIVATDDGFLVETVIGLPVEGPPLDEWLMADPFGAEGHRLEAAGIRTDSALRPVAPGTHGPPLAENVRIAGSLLAGQRYLRERCGDGVAIASGWLAGTVDVAPAAVASAAR